jgi:Domain of unknown function (DUF4388)
MNPKPTSLHRDAPAASSSARPSGFQAQIKGASLADLVQMECLAGSLRIVRVTSGLQTGFLYFRGGALVHATTRTLLGELAALEMLSWNDGSFEPVEREWPAGDSITSGWQSLLIRAAQARDERQATSVVSLRPDGRGARSEAAAASDSGEDDAMPIEVAGRTLRAEDFQFVLRLDAAGSIAVNHGATQDFADIAAYACRLAELIGAHLGVDRFQAVECVFRTGRCFLVLERNGDVVALQPKASTDPAGVRELLGL